MPTLPDLQRGLPAEDEEGRSAGGARVRVWARVRARRAAPQVRVRVRARVRFRTRRAAPQVRELELGLGLGLGRGGPLRRWLTGGMGSRVLSAIPALESDTAPNARARARARSPTAACALWNGLYSTGSVVGPLASASLYAHLGWLATTQLVRWASNPIALALALAL